MAALKYRMAAKLIAIYDCIFTGLALIVLFGLLVSMMFSPGEFGIAIFIVLLPTGYYLGAFLFALNLLRSTKSKHPEEHVCAVYAWMLFKITEFLIGASLGIIYCVSRSPTPFVTACLAVLGMLPAALFQSIYMYFVYQYNMELS